MYIINIRAICPWNAIPSYSKVRLYFFKTNKSFLVKTISKEARARQPLMCFLLLYILTEKQAFSSENPVRNHGFISNSCVWLTVNEVWDLTLFIW